MSLQATMPMISRPEAAHRVTGAVGAMGETTKEIRGAVSALQARDAELQRAPRAEVVRLVEQMTAVLGFAPSLRLGPGLRALDRFLTVTVTDNGVGIRAGSSRRGGLRNLADRAAALSGELLLTPADPSAPQPGTRLEWRVPVAAAPV